MPPFPSASFQLTNNYATAKTDGTATLATLDGANFVYTQQQFDPNTGKPVAPLVVNLSLQDLQNQQTALQAQLTAQQNDLQSRLDTIATILADMQAVPVSAQTAIPAPSPAQPAPAQPVQG